MWSVMPYYPQYLSPTWSCYYFRQSATIYSGLHIYTTSWCGSDGGLQSSYWFLINWCQTAIWYFGVSRSPSIHWLSYPHSWSFSRPYDLFFNMQCSLCFSLWFDFRSLFCCCQPANCKSQPIIVGPSHKLTRSKSYNHQHWSLQGRYP